jgi:hypothetical protein
VPKEGDALVTERDAEPIEISGMRRRRLGLVAASLGEASPAKMDLDEVQTSPHIIREAPARHGVSERRYDEARWTLPFLFVEQLGAIDFREHRPASLLTRRSRCDAQQRAA